MNETLDVILREARPNDAGNIIQFLKQVSKETPYLLSKTNDLTIEEEREYIEISNQRLNSLLFIAEVNDRLVGVASVTASQHEQLDHVGEIGISILKDYWGFGLGKELMHEIIRWAEQSTIIRRLELTVQERNQRAIHLYEAVGFKTEATMPRGIKIDSGELLDVRLMSLMIN